MAVPEVSGVGGDQTEVFLTASAAAQRARQDRVPDLDEVSRVVNRRDQLDSARLTSPLMSAVDAVEPPRGAGE